VIATAILDRVCTGAIGREMAATEPNRRRPDSLRLPDGQLIGPGCVRSPGTDVLHQLGTQEVRNNSREPGRYGRPRDSLPKYRWSNSRAVLRVRASPSDAA